MSKIAVVLTRAIAERITAALIVRYGSREWEITFREVADGWMISTDCYDRAICDQMSAFADGAAFNLQGGCSD